jgi:hypothetical protein
LDVSGALVNTGSVNVSGGATTNQATLDITGAAPSTLTGSVSLSGDALLEFGSGGIKTIGADASLTLDGAGARVSIGAGATNSALSGLQSNAGTFDLEANGGVSAFSLTTRTGLNNSGTLNVLDFPGSGGTLTLGGVLANTGSVNIGSWESGATVTASGLVNTGSIAVLASTLDITSAAPSTVTGSIQIGFGGLLDFASGGITAIGAGASFQLGGSQARASIGAATTTNSALSGLSSNAGAFDLEGDSNWYGWDGVSLNTTTGLNNSGDLSVDAFEEQWGHGEGGSTLTLGGMLSNTGAVDIGNGELFAATTVTAKGLNNTNTGTVTLAGASGVSAQLTIAGQATNSGTVVIGADSKLMVTGAGDSYTQHGGTTTVAGTLAASVNDDGGLIDFTSALTSGTGTGALNVGAGGALKFNAPVDNSHKVTFINATGTLDLGAPMSFAAVINGFSPGDTIDLLNTHVTRFSYAGDTLSLFDASTLVAHLTLSGSYTTGSFSTISDGHGGTDILDPQSSHSLAATGLYPCARRG